MKLMIINGPNLNMLGIREPDHYGRETYADLIRKIECHAEKLGDRGEERNIGDATSAFPF